MKTLSIYGGTLEFDEREHAYSFGGKFVPGVTSILKRLDKPALVQWAANMASASIAERILSEASVPEHRDGEPFLLIGHSHLDSICKDAKTAHRRASREAADIGSQVHAFCEATLIKERVELPEDPKARKGAEAFISWLHAHEVQPLACERMVMSKHWWFCGTADFVGRIDGERVILDFKTSSGLYLEMLLQLAAYAIAVEEELGCERVNTGWIIRLDKKTGKPEPYKIELKDSYRDAFLRVREAHELLTKIEGDIDDLRRQAA